MSMEEQEVSAVVLTLRNITASVSFLKVVEEVAIWDKQYEKVSLKFGIYFILGAILHLQLSKVCSTMQVLPGNAICHQTAFGTIL